MPAQRNTSGVIINAKHCKVDEVVGRRVLCPACRDFVFNKWPFGWDAHAASACCGVEGATEQDRKNYFKQLFRQLFR